MPTIETISQVLSPTNATYINGVSARREFSKAFLENLKQGLIEKDGRGVSNKFVTEQEANDAAQIFVNRVLPIYQKAREHGSLKNGGAYSNNAHFSTTETVGIDILTLLDDPILLPRVTQDRIPVDLLAAQIKNYIDYVNVVLNGSSYAAKWFGTYGVTSDKRNEQVISSTDVTNKVVLEKFQEANVKLDEGDIEHGLDFFPKDTRIGIFRVNYRPTLSATGILVLGGANYAYDIARKGGVSTGEGVKLDDGYWGEIDDVPVHGISNLSLMAAAGFCGLPEKEFLSSKLVGWLSSGYANARGCSTLEQVKIVDEINGQGIRILPLTKIGAVCWYPKGNVAVCNATGYDPIADLKTIFSGQTIAFKLKGAGSRYYSEDIAFDTCSTTKLDISATAKDDFGTDHALKFAYVVTTAAVNTVDAFIDAYNTAGAVKGTSAIGTEVTYGSSQTSGHYANVLVIADDGSCSLKSKAIA